MVIKMKYIFIAGLIGWLLGMSMKNMRLAAIGIPTLYGLVVGFFFSRWAEQNHALAYGIAYVLYAVVVLIWLVTFIRFLSDKTALLFNTKKHLSKADAFCAVFILRLRICRTLRLQLRYSR